MRRKPGRAARATARATGHWYKTALVVAVAVGVTLAWRVEAPHVGTNASPGLSSGLVVHVAARRETRPTLDPGLFDGKAAVAHRVAREIPDTLDQLDCYCGCQARAGHKSLLSCYTDGHAAT